MKETLDPSPPNWLTLTEIAERWKVCKRTITRIPIAQLPYYNLPHQRRYRLQDVVRYERHKAVLKELKDNNPLGC